MTTDEFNQIDLRVGKVKSAERVPGSHKLIKLLVDLGDTERQIVAGIGKVYEPDNLLNKEIVIVANLEARKFTLPSDLGQVVLESQGMLLAARGEDDSPVLLTVDKEVPVGVKIS